MHEKYAFLHCSYSAPVRVDDVALRAIVVVAARAGDDFTVRAVAVSRDTIDCVAPRDVTVLLVRGVITLVRDVVRGTTVVDTRDCVG